MDSFFTFLGHFVYKLVKYNKYFSEKQMHNTFHKYNKLLIIKLSSRNYFLFLILMLYMYYEHISHVQTENSITKHTKIPPFPTSWVISKSFNLTNWKSKYIKANINFAYFLYEGEREKWTKTKPKAKTNKGQMQLILIVTLHKTHGYI